MAAQARAAAWRAWELRRAAKGYSWARRAQRSGRSLALTPRPSIHRRTHLLRMNWVVRMASSIAAAWARERRSLYSYTSMRRLPWSPVVSRGGVCYHPRERDGWTLVVRTDVRQAAW